MTHDVFLKAACDMTELIPGAPQSNDAQSNIAKALATFVITVDELNWVVENAIATQTKWAGVGKLKQQLEARREETRHRSGSTYESDRFHQTMQQWKRDREIALTPEDRAELEALQAKISESARRDRDRTQRARFHRQVEGAD